MEVRSEVKRLNEQLEQETKLVQDKEAEVLQLQEQVKALEAEKAEVVSLQEQVKSLEAQKVELEAKLVEISHLQEQIKTLEDEKQSVFVITKDEYIQSLIEQVKTEYRSIVKERITGEKKDEIKASFDKELALVESLSEQISKVEPTIIGSPIKKEKSLLEAIGDDKLVKQIQSRGEING